MGAKEAVGSEYRKQRERRRLLWAATHEKYTPNAEALLPEAPGPLLSHFPRSLCRAPTVTPVATCWKGTTSCPPQALTSPAWGAAMRGFARICARGYVRIPPTRPHRAGRRRGLQAPARLPAYRPAHPTEGSSTRRRPPSHLEGAQRLAALH